MPRGALHIRGKEGTSAQIYREREELARDSSALRTSCAFCEWSYLGTALAGREKAAQHREKHHPEARNVTRRRRGMVVAGRNRMRDDERAEINAAREKRARLLGIDLQE